MSNGRRLRKDLGKSAKPSKDEAVAAAIAAGAVPMLPEQARGPLANKPVPKRFTPYGSRIACYLEKTPDRTEAGVFVAGSSAGQFITPVGVVIAIGPDVKQVKVDDRVLLLTSTTALKVFYKGDAYVVFEEEKICGIIDPEELKPQLVTGE